MRIIAGDAILMATSSYAEAGVAAVVEMREGSMDTPMISFPETSKHTLAELALGGAIQFERAIAGMATDTDVIQRLATALLAIVVPSWNDGPIRYVAPGYWAPLESMARTQHKGAATVEAVQAYVQEVAGDLSDFATSGNPKTGAEPLRDACLALHEGLIQDLISETTSTVDWQAEFRVPALSISQT
jgi:hypothetical protein